MKRQTVRQAEAALFDYRVPPLIALKMYRRARGSRFGDVTTHFMLHTAGCCRIAAEDNAALDQWATDGGADAVEGGE